jgi:outer membrane protein insertion porin family
VRFPIYRWITGAAFVDAGNTYAAADPVTFGSLAVGVGWGLRIRTPIAPIRFDFGWPLDAKAGDKKFRIHFSIGQIF